MGCGGDSIPRDYSPNPRIAPGIFLHHLQIVIDLCVPETSLHRAENWRASWWEMIDQAPLPPDPLDDNLRSRGIPSPLTLTLSPRSTGGRGDRIRSPGSGLKIG